MGTRDQMAAMAKRKGFGEIISKDLSAFVGQQDSFFLTTASADGQPYVQHRGGQPGFLKVIDEHTLRFPDFDGNRQFITLGNLEENDQVLLFLIDHETKTRIKIWGRGRALNLTDTREIEVRVTAWDVNCQKYIPSLLRENTIGLITRKLTSRITELEAELQMARGQ